MTKPGERRRTRQQEKVAEYLIYKRNNFYIQMNDNVTPNKQEPGSNTRVTRADGIKD